VAPKAALEQETEPGAAKPIKEARYLVAWVLCALMGTVGGAVVGFIVGMAIAMVGGALHAAAEALQYARIGGIVSGIAMSYAAFRLIVDRVIVRHVLSADREPRSQ
jgi:hypothetical protein